jgi:hypothetical protein
VEQPPAAQANKSRQQPLQAQRAAIPPDTQTLQQTFIRNGKPGLLIPRIVAAGAELDTARSGEQILGLVAQTFFVAVFLHPLPAFVLCDFRFSLLF